MRNLILLVPVLASVALTSLAPPLRADRVITEDGRTIRPRKAREVGEGLVLEFDDGVIELADRRGIVAVEIEGDMSDYVPQNDDEREKLEKGYVRYEGRWMSKAGYENLLAEEAAESKARADEIAAHDRFHDGWTKETKHFEFKTNTSPELLEYYADLLETYYDLMDKRFKIKLSPKMRRTKMKVNIYKRREEFVQDASYPVGPGVLGYFSPNELSLNFYHHYEDPAKTEWVALHECMHLLTELIEPDYVAQIWLNEAVADYFGSANISRDKRGNLVIEPGRPQVERILTVQQAIEEGTVMSLKDLFHVRRDDFHGFEYAHAWGFIYFLNNSGSKRKKAFDSFFKDIYSLAKGIEYTVENYATQSGVGKVVSPDEIQRVVLDELKVKGDEGLDELNEEWLEFMAGLPLDAPEARFKRGYQDLRYLGFRRDDHDEEEKALDQALADLEFAIENGVEDGRAWQARALGKLFKGDWRGAKQDLEAAVEREPLNAEFRFYLGMIETGSFTMGRTDDDADFEGLSKHPDALTHFALAAELAPDNEYYQEFYERFLDS